jgi:tetratricopeptide (TPR) repeat protein
VEYALGSLDQITRPLVSEPGSAGPVGEEQARILQWAITYYDRIPDLFGGVDITKEAVARAHRQAGFSRLALGQAKGREDYQAAIDMYERLIAANPERIWLHTGLIETLHEFSRMLAATKDHTGAHALRERALLSAEALIGDARAAIPCFAKALAGAFDGLARDLLGDSDDTASTTRAARLARQATDWAPNQSEYWNTLALACSRQDDWPGAAEALSRGVELNRGEDDEAGVMGLNPNTLEDSAAVLRQLRIQVATMRSR